MVLVAVTVLGADLTPVPEGAMLRRDADPNRYDRDDYGTCDGCGWHGDTGAAA